MDKITKNIKKAFKEAKDNHKEKLIRVVDFDQKGNSRNMTLKEFGIYINNTQW